MCLLDGGLGAGLLRHVLIERGIGGGATALCADWMGN